MLPGKRYDLDTVGVLVGGVIADNDGGSGFPYPFKWFPRQQVKAGGGNEPAVHVKAPSASWQPHDGFELIGPQRIT